MSWTSPRTWVAAEIPTASTFNTHLRDQLLETAPGKASAAGQTVFSTAANAIAMIPAGKYKTADETVNNSTTLQNDDHLAFAIAANEVWAFRLVVYYTNASGTPGIKFAFTVPASCTGIFFGKARLWAAADSFTTSASGDFIETTITTTPGGGFGSGFTFAVGVVELQGVITNSSTAGTIQYQWAQAAAVASNTIAKLGSYMDLKRLA